MEHLKTVCFAEGIDGDTTWMAANALKAEGKVVCDNSGAGTPWIWRLPSLAWEPAEAEEAPKGLVQF